jgi:AcrR family transcriptional regulator
MSDGLRERKRDAIRRGLRIAAMTLMAEHDVDEVTIERIAAAVDVAPRTFFNYFPSKEAVLGGPSEEDTAAFVERVVSRPSALSPLEALGDAVMADLENMAEEDEDWTLWWRVVRRNPQLLPRLIERLGETEQQYAAAVAARTGLAEGDLYTRTVAGCVLTLVRVSFGRILDGESSRSVADVFAEALAIAAGGMRSPR